MYKPDSFDVDFMIKQLSRAMDSVYPDPERLVGQWDAPCRMPTQAKNCPERLWT